jgi:hypothetical protein
MNKGNAQLGALIHEMEVTDTPIVRTILGGSLQLTEKELYYYYKRSW